MLNLLFSRMGMAAATAVFAFLFGYNVALRGAAVASLRTEKSELSRAVKARDEQLAQSKLRIEEQERAKVGDENEIAELQRQAALAARNGRACDIDDSSLKRLRNISVTPKGKR